MGRDEQVTITYSLPFVFVMSDDAKDRFLKQGNVAEWSDPDHHSSDKQIIEANYFKHLRTARNAIRERFPKLDLLLFPIGGEECYATDDDNDYNMFIIARSSDLRIEFSCRGYMYPPEIPSSIWTLIGDQMKWGDDNDMNIDIQEVKDEMLKYDLIPDPDCETSDPQLREIRHHVTYT